MNVIFTCTVTTTKVQAEIDKANRQAKNNGFFLINERDVVEKGHHKMEEASERNRFALFHNL